MDRDQAIEELRPKIPNATFGVEVRQMESFQNQTLRPILKFQNELLIEFYKDYLGSKKGGFYQKGENEKKEFIAQSLQRDQRLRSVLIGLILGLLTGLEIRFYFENNSEINKRIISMLIQRYQSQLSSFIDR